MKTKFKNAKFQVGDFVTVVNPENSINTIAVNEISTELFKTFLGSAETRIAQDDKGVFAILLPEPTERSIGMVKAIDHMIYNEDEELGNVDVYTYALTIGSAIYFVLEFGLEKVDSLIFKN